jgi:hypothetical protein
MSCRNLHKQFLEGTALKPQIPEDFKALYIAVIMSPRK